MNDLNKAISSKLDGWKRTRYNRINISERLKKYDKRWNFLLLFMNSIAIIFLIISLKYPLKNSYDSVISGVFSIYIILLQYFLSNQNYKTRGLKFHYEQLEIENLRYKLKVLLYNKDITLQKKNIEYESIVSQYMISLNNNENHEKIDDNKTKISNKKEKNKETSKSVKIIVRMLNGVKFGDYSMDNLLIYFNFIILITMLFFILRSYI